MLQTRVTRFDDDTLHNVTSVVNSIIHVSLDIFNKLHIHRGNMKIQRIRRASAVAVGAVLLILSFAATPSWASAGAATSAGCSTLPLGPARGVWFGVNLDWANSTLESYATRLGHHPAVTVTFVNMPLTPRDVTNLDAAEEQVRQNGGVLLITLEPQQGFAAVTDASVTQLVAHVKSYNAQGVPVIVRYAQEMNGSWYPWGQDPQGYVASFRSLAKVIHSETTCTAMAWAPNYGGGYPFSGGAYQAKPGTAAAAKLDTNNDGVVDQQDDPYAPYYPGDDAVDWVGLSVYHWGNKYPWGANVVPERGKFSALITGTYKGSIGDERAVPNFYATYAVGHNKPMGVFETAALSMPSKGGASALSIKRAWWTQVFAPSTRSKFPLIKMINWFEWNKYEVEVKGQVDWTTTQDPQVRKAFTSGLPPWLVFAQP